MKSQTVSHQFVDKIPESLDECKLYISIPFATAVHKCACGCGNEVVTPLSPQDWKLTYDGETISLNPSIGNWGFPCQSHYWIKNNQIQSARKWTQEEIKKVRRVEQSTQEKYSNPKNKTSPPGLLKRIRNWW